MGFVSFFWPRRVEMAASDAQFEVEGEGAQPWPFPIQRGTEERHERSESHRNHLGVDHQFRGCDKAGRAEACARLDNVTNAWVKEQKAVVDGGKITKWRVTLHVTFVLATEKHK